MREPRDANTSTMSAVQTSPQPVMARLILLADLCRSVDTVKESKGEMPWTRADGNEAGDVSRWTRADSSCATAWANARWPAILLCKEHWHRSGRTDRGLRS